MHQIAFGIAQMHPVAFAIAPVPATGAGASAHPFAVAVRLEAVGPYVPEVVLIYIALGIVGAYARARADAAVDEH